MSVQVLVAVAEIEETLPMTLDNEPQIGEILILNVNGEEEEFEVTDLSPTGFVNSVPYLFGVYVRPVKI
ncbi:hypothetical protein ACMGEE_01315 [Erwinia sp. DT-104]|uniref:hypothetical protein n=1 Tax=Erwinia sp. DT-104 TaxID=3396161 RepID=UPI003F195861